MLRREVGEGSRTPPEIQGALGALGRPRRVAGGQRSSSASRQLLERVAVDPVAIGDQAVASGARFDDGLELGLLAQDSTQPRDDRLDPMARARGRIVRPQGIYERVAAYELARPHQ